MQSTLNLIEIPVELIEEDPHQPRKTFNVDGDKNRLFLSLGELGVQLPLAVTNVSKNRYRIVDGHRRYRVAKELGWKSLPCRVYDSSEAAKLEKVRFEIQNNRRPWKPLERAEALERIKSLSGFKTNKQLAQHLYLSESLICNSLKLKNGKNQQYLGLLEDMGLHESFRTEFNKLLPKLRPIRTQSLDHIVHSILDKIRYKMVSSAKELRSLGRIFLRANANEEALYEFVTNPDMTIKELERQTIQAGFTIWIEQLISKLTSEHQLGRRLTTLEKKLLQELHDLIEEIARK